MYQKLSLSSVLLLGLPLVFGASAVYAAKPIDLRKEKSTMLQSFNQNGSALTVFRRNAHHEMLHVRMQQTYQGYKVWGADAALHVPHAAKTKTSDVTALASMKGARMNGVIYAGLQEDLASTSPAVFSDANKAKALKTTLVAQAVKAAKDQQSELLIFVDQNNKAHWAYKISYELEPTLTNKKPSRWVHIVDALSFKEYVKWDDIKNLEQVAAGGVGGNLKTGKFFYDGAENHYAKLILERSPNPSSKCTLMNDDVVVKDYNTNNPVSFMCEKFEEDLGLYRLSDEVDAVNGGYAPANDALFGGMVIKQMYRDWYDESVLNNPDGTPMILTMVVHLRNYDNAYWDGKQMTFGDGQSMFYPLVSLGVAAHEISHGFTEQHSDLSYYGQSGGMNEAFSDMAAQAAEVYAYGPGKNSWQIGPEIFKQEGQAIRYMDKPSRDGNSIDDATQYTPWLDVHYSSGVYNRLYYTLSNMEGWDAKKAFDVFVTANMYYWTSSSNFKSGGCGLIDAAANDLGYDTQAIKDSLDVVKIEHKDC